MEGLAEGGKRKERWKGEGEPPREEGKSVMDG